MRTTELARVNLAALDAVVVGYLIALGAMNAIRPTGVLHKLKTRVLIGELLLEVFYGVFFHTVILHRKIRVVKV